MPTHFLTPIITSVAFNANYGMAKLGALAWIPQLGLAGVGGILTFELELLLDGASMSLTCNELRCDFLNKLEAEWV